MTTSERPTREPRRLVHWFDTSMEIVISTLPLLLVVLGIGMMSFTPRRSSIPLFTSHLEAEAFFTSHSIPITPGVPVILVASQCPRCTDLTDSLKKLAIPFVEQSIDLSDGAKELLTKAEEVSGSESLPQVVLGDQLVNAEPYSVKVAVGRFKGS